MRLKAQLHEALMHLAVIVLSSPILFTLADWLRS